MFDAITQDYNAQDATIEILAMLFGAFVLGFFIGQWMKKKDTNVDADSYEEPLSRDASDLKVVEGVGPKIEELLKERGIHTWEDLAQTNVSRLQDILNDAGSRFQMHNPKTWPEQAALARDGKWNDLKNYQKFLIGGN